MKKSKKVKERRPLRKGEQNCQTDCIAIIKKIPDDIKKAKKRFTVGKEYVIQEPPKKRLNTLMSVHIKDDKGDMQCIAFPFFRLTGRMKDGTVVKGTEIVQEKKKKKKRK